MTAPAGAEVGLYVDLVATVRIGDVIETRSGRRYRVIAVREQLRGKAAGRQHLRAVVLEADDPGEGGAVHRIRWYARKGGSARAGVSRRP